VERKELPVGWEWKKMGEVTLKYINGGTPSTAIPEYWDGTIPWTTSKSITSCTIHNGEKLISEEAINKSSSNIVPKNNVLIATRVGIGKSAVNSIDIAISQDLTGVILDKKIISPEFLVRYLHNQKLLKKLESSARGSTIKGLQRSDLDRIVIPLPPLPVQRRIVEILEQADALRHLRAQADAEIQKLLKSVFYEMFGDPVRNEKGWEVVKFGDVAIIEKIIINPDESNDIFQNFIGLENIEKETGQIIFSSEKDTEEIKSAKFQFSKEHILYGKLRPYLNKVALPNFDGICSTDILTIKPNPKKTTREFLCFLMRQKYFVNFANEHSIGANLPRVSPNTLLNYKTPIPPFVLQKQFSIIVKEVDKIRERQVELKKDIGNLFDGLMTKAFAGELN
jgi:type I restriction enzyme S subunit